MVSQQNCNLEEVERVLTVLCRCRDNSDSEILRENDLIQLKFMRNSPFSVRILGTFHY